MKVSEVLLAARELIAREGGWCQGACARDSDGAPVSEEDPRAESFCVISAISISTASEPENFNTFTDARLFLQNMLGVHSAGRWNDKPGRTQLEVVEALERAALQAKKEERAHD